MTKSKNTKQKNINNSKHPVDEFKCDKNLSFDDCELAISKHNVDILEKIQGKEKNECRSSLHYNYIVEEFIRTKKLICYGGTAINNILPPNKQFYNKEYELPDYDFYSINVVKDAKELADIYYNNGFTDVEAKAGVHFGTYKVFVNFIPVADITQLPNELKKSLLRDVIIVDGIRYCHPNFLRMGMYLELSRPQGDVERWEKVFKRLKILNKEYPIDNFKEDFESKPMRNAYKNIEKYGFENIFKLAEKIIKHLAGYPLFSLVFMLLLISVIC